MQVGITAFHYMIAAAGGNSIRCAEFATFGTPKLSHHMLVALKNRFPCLLANHSMICFGANLRAAFGLAIEVEALCRQYILSSQMGTPVIPDDAELEIVFERFKTYGKQPTGDGNFKSSLAFAPTKRN